ncbi:mitochondrial coenzyme A diphosphatase NUDT8 isoform X2 [Alligator mississippiensis]|nr:mitochondrial coenzyme A diphosphatase NUDT8 isoform X2 [Alligator mississippiensis]
MLPALRRLRPGPGLRRPPGARSCRAAAAALSRDNEQRCRALLEASARRYRLEAATAAVLVPLCRAGGQPALLYTLRSRSLRGRHKGDVSFPGGKRDSSDQDMVATALRETLEELGLRLGSESIWGIMRPLPDRWGLVVIPVLADLGPLESLSLNPNPQEVEEVFTLPLSHLLEVQNQGYTHFRNKGHYSYTLPVFLNGCHKVWGLTAIITDLTLELLVPDDYRRRTHVPAIH